MAIVRTGFADQVKLIHKCLPGKKEMDKPAPGWFIRWNAALNTLYKMRRINNPHLKVLKERLNLSDPFLGKKLLCNHT